MDSKYHKKNNSCNMIFVNKTTTKKFSQFNANNDNVKNIHSINTKFPFINNNTRLSKRDIINNNISNNKSINGSPTTSQSSRVNSLIISGNNYNHNKRISNDFLYNSSLNNKNNSKMTSSNTDYNKSVVDNTNTSRALKDNKYNISYKNMYNNKPSLSPVYNRKNFGLTGEFNKNNNNKINEATENPLYINSPFILRPVCNNTVSKKLLCEDELNNDNFLLNSPCKDYSSKYNNNIVSSTNISKQQLNSISNNESNSLYKINPSNLESLSIKEVKKNDDDYLGFDNTYKKKHKSKSISCFDDPNSLKKISSNSVSNNNDTNISNNIKPNIFKYNKRLISSVSYKTLSGKVNSYTVKTNQDSYLISTKVLGYDSFNIFGVFDGHGVQGHLISDYIKGYFNSFFSQEELYVSNKNCPYTKPSLEDVYTKLSSNNYSLINYAFNLCENSLSKTKLDASMSGSTCIIMFIINDKIITANAGDSRAMLSCQNNIRQLSYDHKPDNKDEKNRIINAGGRVHPIKDMGRFIGPNRVWVKKGDYPGLAMSRSIGDLVAKSVGCTCAPEIVETTIDKSCNFIVIGSDGIFEVLSNMQIQNILMPSYNSKSHETSASLLVDKAVSNWRKQSDGQDDITTIIIYIDI